MKVIKRNQLIILVISLMLIMVGYLNFTPNNNSIQTVAELGDARLVSSNVVDDKEEPNEVNEVIGEAVSTQTDVSQKTEEEVIQTAAPDDTYFTTSKLERENMYSQMLESYQQIYNNSETSADQKISALNEIAKINKTKNAIMIAENLISAKGFERVIIFVNDNSISVIVGEEELKPERIAQIQNIVARELNVDVDKIHISTK